MNNYSKAIYFPLWKFLVIFFILTVVIPDEIESMDPQPGLPSPRELLNELRQFGLVKIKRFFYLNLNK